MEITKVNFIVTSFVAISGLGLTAYQILSASNAPAPVQVSVSLDSAESKVGKSDKAVQPSQVLQKTTEAATPKENLAEGKSVQPVQNKALEEVNAQELLKNMRLNLALVSAEMAATKGKPEARQNSAVVARATMESANSIEALEQAIKSKKAKRISKATRQLSQSMGKLEAVNAITPRKTKRAALSFSATQANWATYSSHYALAGSKAKAKPDEVKALRKRAAALESKIANLEAQVKSNDALRREVVRMRSELSAAQKRQDDIGFQNLLLTMAVLSGAFDGLASTAQVHYPDYYAVLKPFPNETEFLEGYWQGYYDGYYAHASDKWYEQQFIVPGEIVLVPSEEIYVFEQVTAQELELINKASIDSFESLPPEVLQDDDIPLVEEPFHKPDVYEAMAAKWQPEAPQEEVMEELNEAVSEASESIEVTEPEAEVPAPKAKPKTENQNTSEEDSQVDEEADLASKRKQKPETDTAKTEEQEPEVPVEVQIEPESEIPSTTEVPTEVQIEPESEIQPEPEIDASAGSAESNGEQPASGCIEGEESC